MIVREICTKMGLLGYVPSLMTLWLALPLIWLRKSVPANSFALDLYSRSKADTAGIFLEFRVV